MSLQQLQSEIEKKAEDEATRILHAANQEAQKIVAEAETKASSVRGERTAALKRELDAQEKAQLAIARMERKGELLQVKANWAKRIFDEAEKKLGEMAQERGREYHELLNNLVLEGIKKIDGTKFIVEVNSRDKEIVKPILNTITQKAGKIKNSEIVLRMESLQSRTIGGVVVSTEDRTQYFNNTLEVRLSTVAARTIEGTVYKILFGTGVNE